ncbi:hypothetical protein AYI68_g201 [Smittium mucronatum]|uniref:Uncharacterized protein n=1 Tax=Smittium mucronatum TaxID=133383 RepID=A0A1R0H922_9FUNG|nr:hypothetical protein AYI68_g201 [Smittium mucronatum]
MITDELDRWKTSYYLLDNIVSRILKVVSIFNSALERVASLDSSLDPNYTSNNHAHDNHMSLPNAFSSSEVEAEIVKDDERMLYASFEQNEVSYDLNVDSNLAIETFTQNLERIFSSVESCYSNFKTIRDFFFKAKEEKSILLKKLGKRERKKLPSWGLVNQWSDDSRENNLESYTNSNDYYSPIPRSATSSYRHTDANHLESYEALHKGVSENHQQLKSFKSRTRSRALTEQRSNLEISQEYLEELHQIQTNNTALYYNYGSDDFVRSEEYNDLVSQLQKSKIECAHYKRLSSKMEDLLEQMRLSLDRAHFDLNLLRNKNQDYSINNEYVQNNSSRFVSNKHASSYVNDSLFHRGSSLDNTKENGINELDMVSKFLETAKERNASFFKDVDNLCTIINSLNLDSNYSNSMDNNNKNLESEIEVDENPVFSGSQSLESYFDDDEILKNIKTPPVNNVYTYLDFLVNKPEPTIQICETWFQLVNAYSFISRRLFETLMSVVERHSSNKFNYTPVYKILMDLDNQLNRTKEQEILIFEKIKEYNAFILSKFGVSSNEISLPSFNTENIMLRNSFISKAETRTNDEFKDVIISIRNELLNLERDVFSLSSGSIELLDTFIYENPLSVFSKSNFDNGVMVDNALSVEKEPEHTYGSQETELRNRIEKIHSYYESQVSNKNDIINQLQLESNDIREKAESKITSYLLIQNYQHFKLTNIIAKNEFYLNVIRLSSNIIGGPKIFLQAAPDTTITKPKNPPLYFWKKAKKAIYFVRLCKSLYDLLRTSKMIELLQSEIQNLKNIKT